MTTATRTEHLLARMTNGDNYCRLLRLSSCLRPPA
jgi:hypothetical protein